MYLEPEPPLGGVITMRSRLLAVAFAFAVTVGMSTMCPTSAAQGEQTEPNGVQVLENPSVYAGTPAQRCAAQRRGGGAFARGNFFAGPHGQFTNVIGPMSICT